LLPVVVVVVPTTVAVAVAVASCREALPWHLAPAWLSSLGRAALAGRHQTALRDRAETRNLHLSPRTAVVAVQVVSRRVVLPAQGVPAAAVTVRDQVLEPLAMPPLKDPLVVTVCPVAVAVAVVQVRLDCQDQAPLEETVETEYHWQCLGTRRSMVPAVAVAPTIRVTVPVLGEPALAGEPEEWDPQWQAMGYARVEMVKRALAAAAAVLLHMAALPAARLTEEAEMVVQALFSFAIRRLSRPYQRSP